MRFILVQASVALWMPGSAAAVIAETRPCTTPGRACQEKVPLGPAERYSLVYRSFSLEQANEGITRAVIVIHGAGRNADTYFASVVAGALIAGALDSTLIVSPRFAAASGSDCRDTLDSGEISWTCGGPQDWRGGGAAQGLPDVHTFDLIDELVKKLGRREMFPRLGAIVVTGHSAGGQFTHRYAAASRAETTGPVPIRYVVSNPSTYLYLDRTRPSPAGSCSEKGCTGEFVEYADGRNCTTYDRWRNGLEEVSGYAAAVPTEDMKKQLVSRDVTYVLSELDTLPLFGFDSSCPAMAQGPNRLARGLAYWHYLRSKFGAQHKLVLVPACGHNGRCVYTDNRTLRVLFP